MPGFSARPPSCGIKGSAAPVSRLRRLLCECEWSALAAAALDNGPAIARDEACRESEASHASQRRAKASLLPGNRPLGGYAHHPLELGVDPFVLPPVVEKSCSVARSISIISDIPKLKKSVDFGKSELIFF